MKNKPKKQWILLSLGGTLLALSFILEHYIALSDVASGFIKGVSIGVLTIALMSFLKSRKTEKRVQQNP